MTLTAAFAPVLEVGRVYSIPAGEGKTCTGYYICDTANGKSVIFGLQPPGAILDWLKENDDNYITNTPQNLMAVRSVLAVTATENRVDFHVDVFQEMKTLLIARNDKKQKEQDELCVREREQDELRVRGRERFSRQEAEHVAEMKRQTAAGAPSDSYYPGKFSDGKSPPGDSSSSKR